MRPIIESDLKVVDILEFMIARNVKTDLWNEAMV